MRSTIAFAALAAVLVAAGCGGKSTAVNVQTKNVPVANVKPGEETTLLPLTVGNQWVYEFEMTKTLKGQQLQSKGLLSMKVTNVTPIPDGVRGTIDVSAAPTDKPDAWSPQDKQVWEVTKKGIFQLTSGLKQIPYTPKMPGILFPMSGSNLEFNWSGTGMMPIGDKGTARLVNKNNGPETVDIVDRSISAIAVDTRGLFTAGLGNGIQKSVAWYAPGVGMVRNKWSATVKTENDTFTLRLKSYSVK